MTENNQGKRVAPAPGRKPAILAVAIIALLVAVYLCLCGYVSVAGRVMPRTAAAGVDLGGLTWAQAADRLRGTLTTRYGGTAVTFTCGDGADAAASVPSDFVSVDLDAAVDAAWRCGRNRGFFLQGWGLLSGLARGYTVSAPLYFPDEEAVDGIIAGAADATDQAVVETTFTVMENVLTLHKGMPGLLVDRSSLKARILSAFENGEAVPPGDDQITFEVTPEVLYPAEPDLDALYDILYTEAKDASFDAETNKILPHTVGVSFDVEATRARYADTGWGKDCEVPLALTQPQVTYEALNGTLFRDVLGSCTSTVGGTSNRVANVTLAASFCDEYVILPGGAFSYNTVVGSRTEARGFLPAPAYVNGATVDEIGGGICQVSSTIYLASLRSNLKILERRNHMYAVGYVPDGMDATVYYGSLDFRFENDTAYPIKLVVTMKNRKLTVQIYGTKTDGITVKMENVQLSTTAYSTIYKLDSGIPAGSVKESVTPYTGRKVEAYRCLYDGNGNLISRTLESVSNYRKRDRVFLINPADAAAHGLDSNGDPLPASTPAPEPTPTPVPTEPAEAETSPTLEPVQTPEVTESPAPAIYPETSAAPEPEASPVGTPGGVPLLTPYPMTLSGEEA